MKKFNFSRLFAAVAFAAVLVLSGCVQANNVSASDAGIAGTWVSAADEKYVITDTDYDNYYGAFLYYSTTDIEIVTLTETSGYVYGKFDDEYHVGYGAEVGQWYALYYADLTANSVNLYQAYKIGGKAACDSLDEAKEEFTVENGYFTVPSACTKSE